LIANQFEILEQKC